MALINRAGDMLLHAEEAEIRTGSRAHGGVPFIGPSHGHGDRVSGVDLHVHVAAPDSGTVDAAGVQAGGLQRDRLAVGGSPDNLILRIRVRGQGAEQQRGENRKVPHSKKYWLGPCTYPSKLARGGLRRYQVPLLTLFGEVAYPIASRVLGSLDGSLAA